MKKYLIWIPVVGFFTVIYYQIIKHEHVVDVNEPLHFYVTAIYQAFSLVILYFIIFKY